MINEREGRPWFNHYAQSCLHFCFHVFIVQISLLSLVEHRLVSLEGWEEELKIAAVSLTPSTTTQVSTFPSWNKCGKKPEMKESPAEEGATGTDDLSIYFSSSNIQWKCLWSSCSAAFNKDPLVVTTRSSTSLPKKVKRRGAWKPGISKCWLCGLGSMTGWPEKKKKWSRTMRAKHPWPPLNHPPHRPLWVMYTLHSSPEDFFLNIFIFVAFICSHMTSCATNIGYENFFFLWRLLKTI